jgi:hypothetical protein
MTVMQNPREYKIPDWFLNRQKDIKVFFSWICVFFNFIFPTFQDGKYAQVLSTTLDNKIREDLERLKKIRVHRGLRHYWGCVCYFYFPRLFICRKFVYKRLRGFCPKLEMFFLNNVCKHSTIVCWS